MGVMIRLDGRELWMLEGNESTLIRGEDRRLVEAKDRLGEIDLSKRGVELNRLPASLVLGVFIGLALLESICEELAASRRCSCCCLFGRW